MLEMPGKSLEAVKRPGICGRDLDMMALSEDPLPPEPPSLRLRALVLPCLAFPCPLCRVFPCPSGTVPSSCSRSRSHPLSPSPLPWLRSFLEAAVDDALSGSSDRCNTNLSACTVCPCPEPILAIRPSDFGPGMRFSSPLPLRLGPRLDAGDDGRALSWRWLWRGCMIVELSSSCVSGGVDLRRIRRSSWMDGGVFDAEESAGGVSSLACLLAGTPARFACCLLTSLSILERPEESSGTHRCSLCDDRRLEDELLFLRPEPSLTSRDLSPARPVCLLEDSLVASSL